MEWVAALASPTPDPRLPKEKQVSQFLPDFDWGFHVTPLDSSILGIRGMWEMGQME